MTAQDLLVAIDMRRYARATVLVAQWFRDLGADVAALADSPLSPLSRLATSRLPITTTGVGAFDSYTAAISLANALVNGVAGRRGQALQDTLERGEALWQQYQTATAVVVVDEGFPIPPGEGEARRG